MSNARNLANLLGTGTTIATAKIADDAITAAKIDDDGAGFTFGDITTTNSITAGTDVVGNSLSRILLNASAASTDVGDEFLLNATDGSASNDGGKILSEDGTDDGSSVVASGRAGQILQVVEISTEANTGNVTALTEAARITITPSSVSSKIFIVAHGAGQVTCGSSGIMSTKILRDALDGYIVGVFYSGLGSATNGHTHYITPHNSGVDKPNTTDPVTYIWAVNKGSGGTTNARVMGGISFPIRMSAMEISG